MNVKTLDVKIGKISYNEFMKTLKDFSFNNKRVLVRCEFDVPLDEKGNIIDDFRIKKSLPTIKYLMEQKAKIILMSHLGRPDGKVAERLKLDKVAEKLASFLNVFIAKEDECVGPQVEVQANKLEPGHILLLENLRFHKEEVDNDMDFAKQISYLGEIYVNDAFGVCHRKNASVSAITQFLPSCAGMLLEKEIMNLDKIMKGAEKPMAAIIGGTKADTKAQLINSMCKVADYVIVSGLIAREAQEKNIQFDFPEKIVSPSGDLSALDINEETVKLFSEKIMQAKTILWNGPFGKFEEEEYEKGTLAIAKAVIESNAYSVVGGGETVEFLNRKGMIDEFSWVSTGGGAMLDYLSGNKLPGIEALG